MLSETLIPKNCGTEIFSMLSFSLLLTITKSNLHNKKEFYFLEDEQISSLPQGYMVKHTQT